MFKTICYYISKETNEVNQSHFLGIYMFGWFRVDPGIFYQIFSYAPHNLNQSRDKIGTCKRRADYQAYLGTAITKEELN